MKLIALRAPEFSPSALAQSAQRPTMPPICMATVIYTCSTLVDEGHAPASASGLNRLQARIAAELNDLLAAVIDRAFKGAL